MSRSTSGRKVQSDDVKLIQFMIGLGDGFGSFKVGKSKSDRNMQFDDEKVIQFMIGLGHGFGGFEMG